MYCQLIIKGSKTYEPIILDGIKWETARKGEPGKLFFTVINDNNINFEEGNEVSFRVDDKPVFQGFVFTKKRNKNCHIQVTAYDQLRYLKNKDTYVYTNKTATELVQMLADDFNLRTGEMEDTGFKIAKRVEDNATLFDMIQWALDETVTATGKLFVLYDDFGKLMIKNIESMKLKTVIDEETAEDFSYTSSIDGKTYNKIKLVYENKDAGKRELYLAIDNNNVKKWGVLQYFEKINNEAGAIAKVNALLQLYNRKTRNLSIKGALGDLNVRAGCSLPIYLNLGDIITSNYLVCERVVHTFKQGHHYMDLTMIGGDGFVR